MKLTEILFWLIIIVTAIFYLTKGNDMHEEKIKKMYEKRAQNIEQQKVN